MRIARRPALTISVAYSWQRRQMETGAFARRACGLASEGNALLVIRPDGYLGLHAEGAVGTLPRVYDGRAGRATGA
jgi:hypothetical protein